MEIRGIVTTTVLILALITISTTTAAAIDCDCGNICVNETGWWRDGGALNASTTPIQAAVDNANAGETICVAAGSYTENVNVNKQLTLRGEGADVVTVTAASSSYHVFEVTADYVNISGFTATRITSYWSAGICLISADHCNISENNCSNNNYGIYLSSSNNNTLANNTANSNNNYGIFLYDSNNNTLANNTANSNVHNGIYLSSSSNNNTLTSNTASSNNYHGIYLSSSSNNNTLTSNTANSNYHCGIHLYYYSSNNTLTSNTASNNYYGIWLYKSSNNTLTSNTMSGNMYNFCAYDSSLSEYTQNIDTSNTVDGKPIYYWVDQKDRQIPSDAGFVGVVNSTNITVRDLTLTNNSHGVLFAYTKNSRIENVTASNNSKYGIYLYYYSNNNTLTNNTASSNNYHGIYLSSSSNNTLASNNANSNHKFGIYLYDSNNNTLAINTADSNDHYGIHLMHSSNNTLTSNTADSNDRYGIHLWSSRDNTLMSNTANSNNDYGIRLSSSSNNNTLTSNTANLNNRHGIYLWVSSNYNTLANNTVDSNNDYGIYLYDSNNNLIYNNYFNNTKNAYDNSNNQWNTTKTSGTNIISGPFLGGNYWGDYAGNDIDWDCLGDTLLPCNSSGGIQSGGDYHPLVVPTDTTPPVITITTPVPYELYTVGLELNFSATDSESGVATIVGNLTNTSGVSQIVDSGFAPAVGVYTLVVTATDNASNTNESDPVFFVVYDSDSGHAIGSGWFYLDGDSTLPDGRAKFGFTARYKDNNSTGKLSFQCKDADIDLKSMSIDWMTVSSVSAQFQGTGTINDEGLYTFQVEVNDNGEPGVGVDHFDIKIWNGTDTEANPYHKAKNIISGGNIQA